MAAFRAAKGNVGPLWRCSHQDRTGGAVRGGGRAADGRRTAGVAVHGGRDGMADTGLGQRGVQVPLPRSGGQPEQRRPQLPGDTGELSVAVDLVDQPGQGFGSGVVLRKNAVDWPCSAKMPCPSGRTVNR
jgi:hypothetical protein